jgi:hypothetical protein
VHSVGVSTFDGSVSVGGTLTYEDVTNVDAIGIITARSGINVSGGQLDIGSNIKIGNAGVITATSFIGSGANLTGLPSETTISGNADNRIITGSGTANTLVAEPNFTWNTQILYVKSATNDNPFQLDTGSSNGAHLRFFRDGTQLHFLGCGGGISLGDSEDLSMRSYDNILMSTGNNSTERLRIDSSGQATFTGSSSSTLGYVFQNGTSGSSADTRVLIKSYSNSGADPYIKFDAGGQDMIVGTSYAGTTNNLLCLGPGSVPSINNNGLRINGLGKTLLSYLAPGQDSIIDLQNKRTRANGHMYGIDFRDSSNESNGNIVIQQNSSGNNAAHMRFYVSPGSGGNGITNGNLVMSLEQGNSVNVYSKLRTNRIEPFNGLPSGAFGGIIQVKWTANVDNSNYSSGSDVVMQTLNITPTRSDARILIYVCYPSIRSYTTGNTRNRLNQHIKRDGTEIYNLGEMPQWRGANFASSGVEINKNVNFVTIDSPNTTNQVTYTATWSSVDGHVWNTAAGQMTMICAELTGY